MSYEYDEDIPMELQDLFQEGSEDLGGHVREVEALDEGVVSERILNPEAQEAIEAMRRPTSRRSRPQAAKPGNPARTAAATARRRARRTRPTRAPAWGVWAPTRPTGGKSRPNMKPRA